MFTVKALSDWYTDVCDKFNAMFKKHGLPLSAIAPKITEDEVRRLCTQIPPEIHSNEIESAVLLLIKTTFGHVDRAIDRNLAPYNAALIRRNILTKPVADQQKGMFAAIGAVQSGKNGSCVLYILLKRLWYRLHGQHCEFLYVCPGDTTIQQMTATTYHLMIHFLKMIIFKNSVHQATYEELVKDGESDENEHGCYAPQIWSMTSKREIKTKLKDRIKNLTAQGKTLITVWDETHYAENEGSIAAQIFGPEIKREVVNNNHQIIFVSATPFTYICSDWIEKIYLKLGPGYVGFNFFNGVIIDKGVPIVTPIIESFPMLQRRLGLAVVPLLPKMAYSSKLFNKVYKKDDSLFVNGIETAKEYQPVLVEQICTILAHYKKEGKTGICTRLVCNNEQSDWLLDEMKTELEKKIKEKVAIIKYYRGMEYKELLTQIDACVNMGRFFIIAVSAKGRMSNRFPKSVEVFIDFTKTYSSATALVQGLVGRAAGYFGQRIVVLSEDNYDILQTYIKTFGRAYKKENGRAIAPHIRATQNGMEFKKYWAFTDEDEKAKPLFDIINIAFGRDIRWQAAQIRLKRKSRPTGRWVAPQVVFPEPILAAIEKSYDYKGFRILRPGEIPKYFEKEYQDADASKKDTFRFQIGKRKNKGLIFFAFRTMKEDTAVIGRVRSSRKTTSIKQSGAKARGIEPHIHFDRMGNIKCIELALYEQIYTNPDAPIIAKPASMFNNHFLQKENENDENMTVGRR